MSRRDLIRNRLCAHILEEQGCAVVCPSKDVVQSVPVAGHLYGWFPPMPLDHDTDLLIVSFCPELMAEITAWLDDEQLDTYLWTIEILIDGYLELFAGNETYTPGEMRNKVESQLFEAEPDALALFSEIELRALDAGTVRPISSPS